MSWTGLRTNTHTEVARLNGGELADCLVTRCKQLDSLLRERRETLFSLEADRDQVGLVELCEVGGPSAVDRCTPSLGGMETPGTLVVTRFPSVSVPVCVVASVPGCVLPNTPCVNEAPCASGTTCVNERVRVSEARCVRGTACVRSLYVREMTVGMREHDDDGHAGARCRVSECECHGMVCERRDTREFERVG